MKFVVALLIAFSCTTTAFAQQQERKPNVRPELRKGNELYKQKKYKEAQTAYMGALQKDPTSYTGMFNAGDALYNDKQYENARQVMGASVKATTDKKEQARSYHNVGNTFLQEKKWEEAINAYKQSLRLNPSDADTKYNLAYANAMLKKNGGGKDKDKNDKNKDNKDNKDKKDQDKKDQDKKDQGDKDKDKKDQKGDQDKKEQGDKDKEKQDQQRPQGQPSKLTKQQADNLLNALRQEEKKLQDKKEKEKGVPVKLDKDW